MSYIVYILKCSDDTLYTWITTDLDRRIRQHNWEIVWGAKYTSIRKPVEVVYSETCENRSEATKREMKIKKFKKEEKLNLINSSDK